MIIQMSNRIRVIFTILLFQTCTSFALELCPGANQAFIQRKESLLKDYHEQFDEQITDPFNLARIEKPLSKKLNQKEIVFLLHGFIGTPFEMTGISEKLRKAGYTTVLDLMPGHGISGWSANHYNLDQIVDHVFANISSYLDCGVRVHLIGFSTGATLIHRYLQTQAMNSTQKRNLASVHLISPFYAPTILFTDLLSTHVQEIVPAPSILGLYLLTKHPDLVAAVLNPDHYMQNLPLYLADEILKLGDTTLKKKIRPIQQKDIPVQAFFSDFDLVASPFKTKLKLEAEFPTVLLHEFPAYLKSPHHLMSPSVNPYADYVEDEILNFIEKTK